MGPLLTLLPHSRQPPLRLGSPFFSCSRTRGSEPKAVAKRSWRFPKKLSVTVKVGGMLGVRYRCRSHQEDVRVLRVGVGSRTTTLGDLHIARIRSMPLGTG